MLGDPGAGRRRDHNAAWTWLDHQQHAAYRPDLRAGIGFGAMKRAPPGIDVAPLSADAVGAYRLLTEISPKAVPPRSPCRCCSTEERYCNLPECEIWCDRLESIRDPIASNRGPACKSHFRGA